MPKTLEDPVRRALRRLLQRKWGQVAAVEDALGRSRGSLARLARGGGKLDTEVFSSALQLLGEDPQDFLHRAADPFNAEDLLEEVAGRSPEPRWIAPLRQAGRLVEEADVARCRDGQPVQGPAPHPTLDAATMESLRSSLCQGSIGRRVRWIVGELGQEPEASSAVAELLEDYRYREPEAAGRLARSLAQAVSPQLPAPLSMEVFCRALGTVASSTLMLGKTAVSAQVLRIAMPLSVRLGPVAEATMLHRVAYLLRNATRFDEALEVAHRVGSLYLRAGSLPGVGRSLALRAALQYYLERPAAAINEATSALEILPLAEARQRAAALQVAVSAHLDLGQLAQAKACFDQMAPLVNSEAGHEAASLLYLQATLCRASGELGAAVRALARARELSADPFDRALASLDILDVLLSQGRRHEAAEEVMGLAAQLQAMEDQTHAQATLMRLCRSSMDDLSQKLVDRVRQAVLSAQARRVRASHLRTIPPDR